MEYLTLGKTGRRVSHIGFGGATAGIPNYVEAFDANDISTKNKIIDAIHTAFEKGINYFDTAAGYGDGISEQIFGEGLQGIPEDKIFLATKVTPGKPDVMRQSIEASLKRLKRDRIDLIQIHGSEYTDELAENIINGGILDMLAKVKSEGLVRHVGFSIECQNPALYRLLNCNIFETVQMEYNLMFQHPYDPGFKSGSLYKAEERNLGIITMRTATSGIFQRWIKMVNPENTFNYSRALIQFVLSNPVVDVALLGMRTVKEVLENVATCEDLSGRIELNSMHTHFVK